MFVGHYGVAFATKKADASIPLWVLFLAVQWLDVIWAPLVLLGIERVRIVPGFTATNPLDLYYMPYTHSLVAAILWSGAAALVYGAVRPANIRTRLLVGLAVFSHWILDFIVHVPDLPLYDNSANPVTAAHSSVFTRNQRSPPSRMRAGFSPPRPLCTSTM